MRVELETFQVSGQLPSCRFRAFSSASTSSCFSRRDGVIGCTAESNSIGTSGPAPVNSPNRFAVSSLLCLFNSLHVLMCLTSGAPRVGNQQVSDNSKQPTAELPGEQKVPCSTELSQHRFLHNIFGQCTIAGVAEKRIKTRTFPVLHDFIKCTGLPDRQTNDAMIIVVVFSHLR